MVAANAVAQGTWEPLQHRPPAGVALPLLLTDGTVMAHNPLTREWYQLKPDAFGSYVNGTWRRLADMPSGYGPLYYSSAVLKDGRVVVIGGEYNMNQGGVWTNKGAVYDPKSNSWTNLPAPNGWGNVGDAQCSVMPDGRFLIAMPFDTRIAILNPTTLTWTSLTGAGKTDRFDEEGWILMPDGTILTGDAINAPAAEKYIPWLDKWVSAGIMPASVEDPGSQEVGPMVLMPNGTVLAMGATGHNNIYTPGASPLDPGTWTAAPDFPVDGGQLDIADGPACLLPNGNVLADASPGVFNTPSRFLEFDGTSWIKVPNVPNSDFNSSYVGNFLVLPNGQVMFTDFSDDVQIYTPLGGPKDAWRPVITNVPSQVLVGQQTAIFGTQFNGLSQACTYGDDSSNATNYPLVRLTNIHSGHVLYAKTSNHSTMAVATGNAQVFTYFQVPTTAELGATRIEVVANGIASAPKTISIVPLDIKPVAVAKLEGASSTGGLNQILNSDNSYFTVKSSFVAQTGQVASTMVTFQVNASSLSGMKFTYESSAANYTSVLGFVFDWTANKWVYVAAGQQSTIDKVNSFQVSGNVAKYFNAQHQVKILLRAVLPISLVRNAQPFYFKADQVKMATL